ncbi:MAG: hypothetical protein NUW21_04085 [Elusimicrobia bacterium]|nr:hypothetical protein [Elusimicrobiota bacterium]
MTAPRIPVDWAIVASVFGCSFAGLTFGLPVYYYVQARAAGIPDPWSVTPLWMLPWSAGLGALAAFPFILHKLGVIRLVRVKGGDYEGTSCERLPLADAPSPNLVRSISRVRGGAALLIVTVTAVFTTAHFGSGSRPGAYSFHEGGTPWEIHELITFALAAAGLLWYLARLRPFWRSLQNDTTRSGKD